MFTDKAKETIAKRIKGIADFSKEKDVTVLLEESALENGRQYTNVIVKFRMSAKEFRSFSSKNLDNVKRAEKRNSDAISIVWYGKSATRRNEISSDLM